jgi:hypothetical protein
MHPFSVVLSLERALAVYRFSVDVTVLASGLCVHCPLLTLFLQAESLVEFHVDSLRAGCEVAPPGESCFPRGLLVRSCSLSLRRMS